MRLGISIQKTCHIFIILTICFFAQCNKKTKTVSLATLLKNDNTKVGYITTCKIRYINNSRSSGKIVESSLKDSLASLLKKEFAVSELYEIHSYGQVAAELAHISIEAANKPKNQIQFRIILNRFLEQNVKEKFLLVSLHYGAIVEDPFNVIPEDQILGTVKKVFPSYMGKSYNKFSSLITLIIDVENKEVIEMRRQFLEDNPEEMATLRKHVNYLLSN